MPWVDFFRAGMTAQENQEVASKSLDAQPARGEVVLIGGTLYVVMDVIHDVDNNRTRAILSRKGTL